ncbi:MAG: hypothetical protein OEW11_09645 [Nitrospirota bacterium]|nr:hypothetical protein [Nitrospirota bacterium]
MTTVPVPCRYRWDGESAVCVIVAGDREVWIPKSQLSPGSWPPEPLPGCDQAITLHVAAWLVQKRRLA